MFPIFKLILIHEKITAIDLSHPNVIAAHFEISFFEAHGGGTIAATTALVEHQIRSKALSEAVNHLHGFLGNQYSSYMVVFVGNHGFGGKMRDA